MGDRRRLAAIPLIAFVVAGCGSSAKSASHVGDTPARSATTHSSSRSRTEAPSSNAWSPSQINAYVSSCVEYGGFGTGNCAGQVCVLEKSSVPAQPTTGEMTEALEANGTPPSSVESAIEQTTANDTSDPTCPGIKNGEVAGNTGSGNTGTTGTTGNSSGSGSPGTISCSHPQTILSVTESGTNCAVALNLVGYVSSHDVQAAASPRFSLDGIEWTIGPPQRSPQDTEESLEAPGIHVSFTIRGGAS